MLTITIPEREYYNEETNEFIKTKAQKLRLEHSLVSISKWESKWKKPFIGNDEKSLEESIDYIRCMTITQNVKNEVYNRLTQKNMDDISSYIEEEMTATTFNDLKSKKTNNEIVTSEIIYYWMIALNIPLECQKWHLNRLLTLINVTNIKNQPPKKMTAAERNRRNSELNAQRRARFNTKG